MENPDNPPRLDSKLKRLDEEQLDVLWDLRYKDERGTKLNKKLSAIRAEIPLRYGFTVSRSTVSIFYQWLRSKREWEADAAAADNEMEEYRRSKPGATAAELLEVGQIKFTARAMQRGDDEGFVRLLRAVTARENALTAREKAAAASRSKLEAGLDALMSEIQASPRALEIFQELKTEVAKA